LIKAQDKLSFKPEALSELRNQNSSIPPFLLLLLLYSFIVVERSKVCFFYHFVEYRHHNSEITLVVKAVITADLIPYLSCGRNYCSLLTV